MNDRFLTILRQLGSHEVTLALLGAVALVVAGGLAAGIPVARWIVVPLGGLFVNLAAALVAQPTLRAQPMLFAFHAMLGVLLLLIAADRLTALRGHVEITEGAMFDPSIAEVEAGPLHPYHLDRVAFVQGPFEIRYMPGMKRRETISLLRIPEPGGRWTEARVGDDNALIFGDYRFYTSFNKGFAPVIAYTDAQGQEAVGAVHMPSYPLRDFEQGNDWTPPGGAPLKFWLSIEEPIFNPDAEWVFRKPKDPTLVVIEGGGSRHPLALGQSVVLAGGASIRFEALRTWMGYTISANPFSAWMIASAIVAFIALAAHLCEKLMPSEPNRSTQPELRHAE